MLQISPTVYINPFMLDAVLSKQGEDTLYTSTEGTLHREGPTTAQLAANGFLQFGDLWISNLDIDFVSLFNDNGDTVALALDFKHPLEHKPRIVTFYVANDMLGDVTIQVTGYAVTFTSPTAGQYLQVYIGGPLGLAKL